MSKHTPDLLSELKECKSLLARISGFLFGSGIRDYEDRINARLDAIRAVIAKAEGDKNLTRCDCCDKFKDDCQDFPSPDKQDVMWLCGECREGINDD